MKVMLIDIDSKIPNLALKKIEKYHKDKGDEVIWNFPLMRGQADKTYVSCIFNWNKDKCKVWENCPNCEIGGSGYDLKKELPPEIEAINPKINWGFTTRGCIRNCEFCIVPQKEGRIRVVGDIYDIWDGISKEIMIEDNNILALPKHFFKIASQIKKEKLKVDFNQGLDHRLLTKDICRELLSLHHIQEIRFAFDYLAYKPTVIKALELLKSAGLKDWGSRWYIYVGEKDTYETVYKRMNLLKQHRQNVYVSRDKKVYNKPEFILLAGWGNKIGIFKSGDIKEVCDKSERMKRYKKYLQTITP